MGAAEGLDVDALGAWDYVAGVLGELEINFIGIALTLVLYLFLFLFVDLFELALLRDLLAGSLLELEQIIGDVFDIATLVAAAHYYILLYVKEQEF